MDVGKGTPGSRLKNARPEGEALREFVRRLDKMVEPNPLKLDAIAWLASKRYQRHTR